MDQVDATNLHAMGTMPPTDARFSMHEKIDIARGVFAALVVMAHALEIAWGVHPGTSESLSRPWHAFIFCVFGTGTYYVMGFFILSGYCIHRSVARSMSAGDFRIRHYFLARMSRILPLYYVALFATLLVEWAIADARPQEWPHGLDLATFLGQVVMIQRLTETFGSFASSWSITNEVFYYLFFGILACLAAGRGARPVWVGMGVCVLIAILTQALYVTVGRNPIVYRTGELFGLGIIWFAGALVSAYGERLARTPWLAHASQSWPIVLASAIAWKTFGGTPHGMYLISGLAFTLMMVRFLASSPARPATTPGIARAWAVETLGASSYPLYLFHGPILMFVGSLIMRWGAITDWRVTWAILVAIGLASGVVLGWGLERPIMAWRARFLSGGQRREPACFPSTPLGPRTPAEAGALARS